MADIGRLSDGGPVEQHLIDAVPSPFAVGVGLVDAAHLPESFLGVPPR